MALENCLGSGKLSSAILARDQYPVRYYPERGGGGLSYKNDKILVFGSITHVDKNQDTTESKDMDQAL